MQLSQKQKIMSSSYSSFAQFVADDGKIQTEFRHVSVVVTKVEQILMQNRVERSKMMNIQTCASLAEKFGQEEVSHW